MNVFLDTNVLLDVLGRREPFYADSAAVWTLAETGRVDGFISAMSFPNLFYVLRRAAGARIARRAMSLLRDIFRPVALDGQVLNQALDAGLGDFEDAIQFFSALRAAADCLVTRNVRDFPRGELPIQTPAEFLAAHFPG
jgi:predicted nucleic acid-binding protein